MMSLLQLMVTILVVTGKINGEEANGDVISYIQSVEQRVNKLEKGMAKMEDRIKEEIKQEVKKGSSLWLLQKSNVCFAARDNKAGKFNLQQEGKLVALKLVHKSGYVACATGSQYRSNWGCVHPDVDLGVYITDANNRQIFPQHVTHPTKEEWHKLAWYFMPGYTSVSPLLVFTDMSSPMYAMKGQEVRVWYGEDLINFSEENDSGTSCADVYAQFS